ncbi:uncharacterized protein LOC144163885 [Haemaphysalis longicornis]
MILILKPGKSPNIDNLRAVSLTSCGGKMFEHVLMARWQDYLEDNDLTTMIGFRRPLCTQAAMLQLRHLTIDRDTRDTRAVFGFDLQGAFDNVNHSAIQEQVSRVDMGKRSHEYTKSFPTGRTAALIAGDVETEAKEIGSRGTPQGSVISQLLFNLRVAHKHADVENFEHTIYADAITKWVKGGSDAQVKGFLLKAVRTVEGTLEGTGLTCSPSKSELLLYKLEDSQRKQRRDQDEIKIYTHGGSAIPRVSEIRVLGMLLNEKGNNGEQWRRSPARRPSPFGS